ncbi:hypothetical protein ISS86_03275 [Candidatus Microgenomates bacterium]|nr:hypothetical protein [Candidatus Microgenomates bacterium]
MTEFNPTSLPEGLTGLEAVNQPVFGVTKQVLNRLEKGYTPGQEVNAQIFKAGEGPHSLKDKLKEDLLALSSEGSDKVNFQVQWLTVLTAFQQLGASRARGEGKNNQGSDKSRFAVRMLQTYLIESTDPAFQVESVASDQQRHKSLVAVAEF